MHAEGWATSRSRAGSWTYTDGVASTGITDAELEQLAKEFAELRDEAMARVDYRPDELHELAERHRRLAKLSDSEGQRRALIVAAERYELEAQNRAAVRP